MFRVATRPNGRREWLAGLLLFAATVLASCHVSAQQPAPQKAPAGQPAASPAPAKSAATANPAPTPGAIAVPDADRLVALVRTSLLTLHDAMQTGNFSVLRERASPTFQAANTVPQLTAAFTDVMKRGVDLSGVAITVPTLTATPAVDASNHLHIAGQFPGQPQGLAFKLEYEPVAGQWRLFGLAVNLVAMNAVAQQAAPPAKQQAAAPAPADKKAAKK